MKHEVDKVVVYERAGLLFVFNFHPSQSFTDYRVGVQEPGEYKIILSSDEKRFGGFDNISLTSTFFTTDLEWHGRKNFIQVHDAFEHRSDLNTKNVLQVYIPCRTCIVLAK